MSDEAELQAYLQKHNIEALLKEIVVKLCLEKPNNALEYIKEFISKKQHEQGGAADEEEEEPGPRCVCVVIRKKKKVFQSAPLVCLCVCCCRCCFFSMRR